MSLSYLPLYIADYELDAGHLTLEQDGAYNRLLRLLWRTPGCTIPTDPEWIANKMRIDRATYDRVVAPVIAEFLKRKGKRFYSPRLLAEWEAASESYLKRAEAGRKGGRARKLLEKHKTSGSIAKAGLKPGSSNNNESESQSQSQSQSQESKTDRESLSTTTDESRAVRRDDDREGPPSGLQERDAPTDRERLLVAMGVNPFAGRATIRGRALGNGEDMERVRRWMLEGLTIDEIEDVVREVMAGKPDGPPSTFQFFEKPIARRIAARNQPIAPVHVNGHPPSTAIPGETEEERRARVRRETLEAANRQRPH